MTARVRVHYPLESGRLILRTDGGWDEDLEPVDGGASHFDFCIRSDAPFIYFKPVVLENGTTHWAVGANYLALAGSPKTREIYPYFRVDDRCSACEVERSTRPMAATITACSTHPATTRTCSSGIRCSTCTTGKTSSFPTRRSKAGTGKSRKHSHSSIP